MLTREVVTERRRACGAVGPYICNRCRESGDLVLNGVESRSLLRWRQERFELACRSCGFTATVSLPEGRSLARRARALDEVA